MAVDAGTIYSEVRIEIEKLNGDVKKIEALLSKFGKKMKKGSEETTQRWQDSFKKIGIAGVVAFAAIGLAVKQAIGTFAKYEQAMANVRSVTDATAEDFKELEAAAIEAGESTRFTATQAADALYFLASAGLDATQSINALQGVLQLAGATGSDLAFTSATMAATLSQFSLSAESSTRVSNVFAAAIANSQATMEKLATSMKKVGPIAGAFGISLEETTANLEALFAAGFTGEESGTALRNIMLGLTKESGPLIQKLEQLGVAFEDVNPQEVGLTDSIQALAESGVDLAQVFETRTAAAILKLADTGGEALRQLEADITDTNSASEMYAIQNDTLAGSIDFLKSAMESASINMVKDFAPAIRGIVDFIRHAVIGFNSMPGPLKTVITVLATAVPVIGGITFAVSKLKGALTGMAGTLAIIGIIVAVSEVAHAMNKINIETMAVNRSLENAAESGKDLNTEMVNIARNTGKSLDEIRDIALANENIKEILIEQDRLNQEIINKYSQRVISLGVEVELNKELLLSSGLLGRSYRVALDAMLERLEVRKEEAVLAAEELKNAEAQAEIDRQTAEDKRRSLEELADLEEEFRREQLTEQELAEDDLLKLHQKYQAAGIDSEEWYYGELAAIREKYKDQEDDIDEEAEATKRLLEVKEQYRQKLEDIGKTQIELLELQRSRAEEEIRLSDATDEAKKAALVALNEYYDLLIDNTANAIFKENFLSMTNTILSGFGGILGAIAQLSAAMTEARIAELDKWLEAELEAAGLVEETTTERLQRELAEAIEAGDLTTAAELEDDLARAQIEAEYQRELARIKYEGELKQWKYTLAIGIASAASAILSGFATKPFLPVGLAAGILATVKSAIQVKAIKAQKPKPPGAQTGGIVLPSTGGTELNVAENQAPELLLNGGAEGEAFLNQFAQRIADIVNTNSGGNKTLYYQFMLDGKKIAEGSANYYNNGIVRLKL